MQFLSPELLGFTSYLTFRNRYAEMMTFLLDQVGLYKCPKYYKRLDELEHKLKDFQLE